MKKVVLSGGGTAGHVTPNIALIPELEALGYEIHYIGSYDGIEKSLIADYHVIYHGISSGKLRRYFDFKNFTDPFRVLKGFFEANKLIKSIHPDVVFSKGGFVTVPVVIAAKINRIPAIIHESDITPGLANKLCFPFSQKVCCTFPETISFLPKGKALLTGTPIRKELFQGDKISAIALCHFLSTKPTLMIIGGSLGAGIINRAVRGILPQLLERYQIIHLCGNGNLDESLNNINGYMQFEYCKEELKDLFSLTDIVVSRAGANALCELLSLKKPSLLIPLSAKKSRGDQILNAHSFQNQGFSMVIEEESLTNDFLLDSINQLFDNKQLYLNKMNQCSNTDSTKMIINLLTAY